MTIDDAAGEYRASTGDTTGGYRAGGTEGAGGEFRAGGTDLMERRRSGRSAGPLTDVPHLPGLREITWLPDGGVRLGALVTVDTLATDPALAAAYPALSATAAALATPQIRRVATLGGALLQRTRCRFYRNEHFSCFKSGGTGCPARERPYELSVCVDLGPCVAPHPSSVGMALLTYETEAETTDGAGDADGRSRGVAELYGDGSDPSRDHLLAPGELLTAIRLGPPSAGERAAYRRATSRAAAEWPLAEAVARLTVEDGVITSAGVGAGGVAAIPLRLPDVERALIGRPPEPGTFEQATRPVAEWVSPFAETRHKPAILRTLLMDVLAAAAS
ncbi:oxidoreductase [Nonomuraea sp. NN258]|uniref:FAD binding domain-containing protein n=1 Tax=Nonomuraea antri TaxID=2730852 RepID=UPI001568D039|nr:FAD binding domain-containing protein [Nonomuraea antri]NRQ31725.1 oxidoreductase [Nonomuraea antri]